MIAVSAGRFEVVKYLLSFAECDVNHRYVYTYIHVLLIVYQELKWTDLSILRMLQEQYSNDEGSSRKRRSGECPGTY